MKGGLTMENQVIQIPLYVKFLVLIGVALAIFILGAWEVIKKWITLNAIVSALKSRNSIRKRTLSKRV
jgi:hypothetical protein